MSLSRLETPIISAVIGEGGSGGALALAVCDRLLMLENATYSVITPEGCASILWGKSGDISSSDFASKTEQAASSLKVTATELKEFAIVDEIVSEPEGGAHRDFDASAGYLKEAIVSALKDLDRIADDKKALIDERYSRYRKIGSFWN